MIYSVSKKPFNSEKLIIECLNDELNKESKETIIEKAEFFNRFKRKISNLNIKELSINYDNLFCQSITKSNETYGYEFYDLSNGYQKLNNDKLKKIYDYYIFDDNLVEDRSFNNEIDDLLILFDNYKNESIKEITNLEKNEKMVLQILKDAAKMYNFFKHDEISNLDISKENIINAYQLISTSDYIKNAVVSENKNMTLINGAATIPLILASPLAFNMIANELNMNSTLTSILCMGGTIAVSALSLKSLNISDNLIEKKYNEILSDMRNYLEKYYNIVYDENEKLVKTLKKTN